MTVEEYLAGFEPERRAVLDRVRAAIRDALPDAEERVRYGMPAVMLNDRYAIHYAGWKKHVGIYPVTRLDGDLEERIAPYRAKKDSVNFPYDAELPYGLITDVASALSRLRT